MGKPATARKLATNEASATLSNLRSSPRKLGLVADLIRGLNAFEAIVQLDFCKRRVSKEVKGVLQSAIANAENNHNLDIDRLFVKEVRVGKGLVMKRFRARARGRGAKILKPFSNIVIVLSENDEE